MLFASSFLLVFILVQSPVYNGVFSINNVNSLFLFNKMYSKSLSSSWQEHQVIVKIMVEKLWLCSCD